MFRGRTLVDDLDLDDYQADVERIVSACIDAQVEIVPSVANWCAEHSGGQYSDSELDNPVGKALWGSPTEPDRILLRRHLPAQLIDDHLLAMFIRGFRQVHDQICDSRTFLYHLVLHEVAHIKHNWRQEQEAMCDEWAFQHLQRWLET